MAAALNARAATVPAQAAGFERYWPLCLAVALLAMTLFYVTLQGLVRESAARAAALSTEPATKAAIASLPPFSALPPVVVARQPAAAAPAAPPAQAAVVHAQAAAAVVEVSKCLMPTGEAAYSDGPCPRGSQASTLRLPRDVNVAARL